ncbi:methyltransferase domain-containing protein [Paenibacillus radicis (ex Xue et al. 2023)]|uniref:Methyltransferase domain-containing protein n=1 Tax=Paenibacillus radicis (ex Xue et al. 2023) TaxID=2972489 RepID=A0ABT1YS22_9BACL|nr:methyltransferase domain-containing protein [Paenibacillus radicis (ex Xue et al. 2023)]MCR8635976.1 methyltransferase domain-containing protein [Paenibacillus radicis (ex Xue et al. 2023)]
MSNLTVDRIMNRIKTTLTDAQKKRTLLQENKSTNTNDFDHQLSKLILEIEQCNRKWNINSEYAITSHRPILGRFIIFGKKVIRKLLRWYINPVIEQQKDFNASVTRSLNILSTLNAGYSEEIKNLNNENEMKNKLKEELDFIENRIIELESLTSVFEEKIKQFVSNINHQIIEGRETLDQRIQENFQKLSNNNNIVTIDYINKVSQENVSKLQAFQNKIEQVEDTIMLIHSRIRKKNNHDIKSNTLIEDKNTNNMQISENKNISIDYFLFEQKFRGTRSAIIERQRFYLPFFIEKKKILDIGCGRGEFIELLGENGKKVTGIDLNQDMVDYCNERGFDVHLENALDYLKNIEKNTLDAIFMAQVIEHLSNQDSLELLDSIYRVLEPGGFVVIETINVQSVFAMNNWFYLDPTHIKPVHPIALKFILQGIGFNKVEIKYLSPVENKGIPPLIIEGHDTNSFNNSMADLNGLIYGFQDYAIFAYK